MKHEFDLEQIDYDNSNYELDIWSSCFNPIFSPPPEVIKEWNLQFDDDWDEPEPTLENTSVYFTEDGALYQYGRSTQTISAFMRSKKWRQQIFVI